MSNNTIRSTTQEHLDIEDIVQNLVLLKDGGAAIVLKIGAVNFDLLSEEEQDGIIYAYAALLNSLTFPIQILIRSQQKDITSYLKLLQNQESSQASPLMRKRLSAYRLFVEKLVKERRVLDKKCYVAIPFFRTELGLASSTPFNFQKSKELPYDKPYIIEKALASLEPKRDHLLRQFGRIGLITKQLPTQDLIELFYSAYNPRVSVAGAITQSEIQPIVQSDRV